MSTPTGPVLVVDDEPLVLDAIQRQHGRRFTIHCASGGAAALEMVKSQGPFAVVVSDYNMPNMDGVTFLATMREVARDTVRVLLTGQADVRLAVNAVNRGAIFRFATKPCPPDDFAQILKAALEQHRLLVAERELLELTLAGCVRVLADILALVSPDAFGRATRARDLVRQVAANLCPENAWAVETAALLSQVGLVAVPPSVLDGFLLGAALTANERAVVDQAPATAATLLAQVPRMGPVAEMVRLQHRRFDGTDAPAGDAAATGDKIPVGARILAAALALEERVRRGSEPADVLAEMREDHGAFDPIVLDAFEGVQSSTPASQRVTLAARQLAVEMVVDQDVLNHAGAVVVPRGHEITVATLARLRSHIDLRMLQEPIRVVVRGNPKDAVPRPVNSLAPH